MSDVKEQGGPASAMTLRDYFAAKAMQALLQSAAHAGVLDVTLEKIAPGAYEMADALLKARTA